MKVSRRFGLTVLVIAATLLLASCGGGAGSGSSQQGANGESQGDDGSGMQGMDHGEMQGEGGGRGMSEMEGMDHGAMGSGEMARQMVMENGKYSDRSFIDAMVPHHQGAIDMAEVALKNAEHERIKQLSRAIILTQEAEIEELKSIKEEEFGTSEVPMEMGSEEMEMMGMTDPAELANKEPFDKAFIDAMIPHHQSAIEMAQVASEKSENPEIKELAENIVTAQQQEIAQMLQWREAWYPTG
jgi:uncharacterized protein (DUF305 family)